MSFFRVRNQNLNTMQTTSGNSRVSNPFNGSTNNSLFDTNTINTMHKNSNNNIIQQRNFWSEDGSAMQGASGRLGDLFIQGKSNRNSSLNRGGGITANHQSNVTGHNKIRTLNISGGYTDINNSSGHDMVDDKGNVKYHGMIELDGLQTAGDENEAHNVSTSNRYNLGDGQSREDAIHELFEIASDDGANGSSGPAKETADKTTDTSKPATETANKEDTKTEDKATADGTEKADEVKNEEDKTISQETKQKIQDALENKDLSVFKNDPKAMEALKQGLDNLSDDDAKYLAKCMFGNMHVAENGQMFRQPTQEEFAEWYSKPENKGKPCPYKPIEEGSAEHAVAMRLLEALDKNEGKPSPSPIAQETASDSQVAREISNNTTNATGNNGQTNPFGNTDSTSQANGTTQTDSPEGVNETNKTEETKEANQTEKEKALGQLTGLIENLTNSFYSGAELPTQENFDAIINTAREQGLDEELIKTAIDTYNNLKQYN